MVPHPERDDSAITPGGYVTMSAKAPFDEIKMAVISCAFAMTSESTEWVGKISVKTDHFVIRLI